MTIIVRNYICPFIIYTNLECLVERTDNTDDENLKIIKSSKHISIGYSVLTDCLLSFIKSV